jgi:hypothetical protein
MSRSSHRGSLLARDGVGIVPDLEPILDIDRQDVARRRTPSPECNRPGAGARGYLVRSDSGSFAPHCATSLITRAESHRISAKAASSNHVSRECLTQVSH